MLYEKPQSCVRGGNALGRDQGAGGEATAEGLQEEGGTWGIRAGACPGPGSAMLLWALHGGWGEVLPLCKLTSQLLEGWELGGGEGM